MTGKEQSRLVLLAQSGDRHALDLLLRATQGWLFAYLLNLVRERELTLDVLQESFLLIYRKLRWLQDPEAYRSWVYRLASRKAFELIRRRRRFESVPLEEQEERSEPPPPSIGLRDEIRPKIDRLPPNTRAVIVLHYFEECSLGEIAEILSLPVGTVKSRLAYGLGRLRKTLGNTDGWRRTRP